MVRRRVVPLALVLLLGCRGARQPAPIPAPASTHPAAPPPPAAAPLSTTDAAAVDRAIRAEWAKEGVLPALPASDARFLRRAYVDIVGVIPPPDEVTAFLADTAPDKRQRLVSRLLESPAYVEHWAGYWDDLLVGEVREQAVDRAAFRAWLADALRKNTPWNVMVQGLVTATGQNSLGGPRAPFVGGAAPMAAAGDDEEGGDATPSEVNGAVNWLLKYKDTPQDLAGTTSRVFLGVQIQCAQCHDHKTEAWKQTDFQSFAACFVRTRTAPMDKGKVMGLRRFEVSDLGRPAPRLRKNADLTPILAASPRALDGKDLSKAPNVRRAIAEWITAPENPWFARAIVNRMWGHFLGRGFVDPVDDLRPSNPGVMPDLQKALPDDFVAHGYDLHRLIATLAATEVYALSSAPPAAAGPKPATDAKAGAEIKLWSRFRLEPLAPEELLRSLLAATDVEDILRQAGRADVGKIRGQLYKKYSFLFDVDEEGDQADFEGTVAQALTLLNGKLTVGGSSGLPGGALAQVLALPGGDAAKVDALYLRTVSRHATPDETAHWVGYVSEARAAGEGAVASPADAPRRGHHGPRDKAAKPHGDALERLAGRDAAHADPTRQAYEDVFWALLNSSEFLFNH